MSNVLSGALAPLPRSVTVTFCAGVVGALLMVTAAEVVSVHLLARIAAVRPPTAAEMATKRGVDLRLALPGSRWQVLELDRPVEALGIYGLRRSVRTLGLSLNEPHLLADALEASGYRRITEPDGR